MAVMGGKGANAPRLASVALVRVGNDALVARLCRYEGGKVLRQGERITADGVTLETHYTLVRLPDGAVVLIVEQEQESQHEAD